MPGNGKQEQWLRDRAYFIWEREGRPHGRAFDHWLQAKREAMPGPPGAEDDRLPDEEKILAGRSDVNMPALLTRDVPGG